MTHSDTHRAKLRRIHELRLLELWGEKSDICDRSPWPKTDADWRKTPHGAPWDTNVEMAEFHLRLSQKIKDEGLLE